jgi:AcrR family transcriptional regulator
MLREAIVTRAILPEALGVAHLGHCVSFGIVLNNMDRNLSMIYLLIGMKHENVTSILGRPRAFDVEKALHRAMQVFWRKGYLGTPLSDLTEAMGTNRPSVYATFGNKKSLFRKALAHPGKGPSSYLSEALQEPTARAVVERLLRGVVNLLTDPRTPTNCLWVHGALSCGDEPLREQFPAQRAAGLAELRARFKSAVADGDLPPDSDADTLARCMQTVNFGLTVQASTGATTKELLRIATSTRTRRIGCRVPRRPNSTVEAKAPSINKGSASSRDRLQLNPTRYSSFPSTISISSAQQRVLLLARRCSASRNVRACWPAMLTGCCCSTGIRAGSSNPMAGSSVISPSARQSANNCAVVTMPLSEVHRVSGS